MQCVILAAGKGTRMKELTNDTPKPMLPLLGRPMLEWKLEMLPEGIDGIVLVIGYLGDRIRSYFGDAWNGIPIRYVVHEKLDGSGGAIRLVFDRGMLSGPTLVVMGDDLYHQDDLRDLMKESSAVLGLEVDRAEHFGLLEEAPDGMLEKITERPHGRKIGTVNTAAYVIPEDFFRYPLVRISETEFGLPQTLAVMAKDMPVKVLKARAWQPVGTPEDIPKGEEFLRRHRNNGSHEFPTRRCDASLST